MTKTIITRGITVVSKYKMESFTRNDLANLITVILINDTLSSHEEANRDELLTDCVGMSALIVVLLHTQVKHNMLSFSQDWQ